jgi:hypothetical protein
MQSEVKLTFADFVSAKNSRILALSAWWILFVYRRGFSYILLVRSQLIKQIQSVKFTLKHSIRLLLISPDVICAVRSPLSYRKYGLYYRC